AENTTFCPSGEIAGSPVNVVPAGGRISNRIDAGGKGLGSRKRSNEIAPAARTAIAKAAGQSLEARALARIATASDVGASSINNSASAAERTRCLGSFFRHDSSIRLSGAGVLVQSDEC